LCRKGTHSIPEWEHMTDNTTETNETEPERDDVEPTEEPETGTDTEHADDNSEDAAETADSSTPTSGDGEDVDWRAKAELYKAQMRKNEQRAKANYAENQRLLKELETLRTQLAEGTKGKSAKTTSGEPTTEDEDPIVAQIKQLSAELAEVRETSKRLAEETARAKRQQLIAEVAAAKGLTLDQARRLQGETREELEADADELVALFGLNRRREPAPKPKPREKKPLRGGATNDSDEERLFGGRSRREILEAVTSTGRRRR